MGALGLLGLPFPAAFGGLEADAGSDAAGVKMKAARPAFAPAAGPGGTLPGPLLRGVDPPEA